MSFRLPGSICTCTDLAIRNCSCWLTKRITQAGNLTPSQADQQIADFVFMFYLQV